MVIFDSHAHYDDSRFEREYEGGAMAALRDAKSAGVEYIVNSGADIETSRASISFAKDGGGELPQIYASVGIHPSETGRYELSGALDTLRRLSSEDKVVAIGEIGLDYHYPDTDKKTQAEFFRAQMELARELSMPVVIHDRDAHGDIFDVVREFRDLRIMLHCYSGSPEMARQYADMGVYLSFGGVLTFKNAPRARESASVIPRELLMLETDAPYLAPVSHRGKLNTSAYMVYTVETLAGILGIDAESAAAVATENSKRFYNIK